MSRNCDKPGVAGFTLMEVLVVLATLGMILWMAGQLLFPMRAAAERQRLQVEARQTARSATDYIGFIVRGATDMNDAAKPRNPAALLPYLWRGATTGTGNFPACPGSDCVQMSYNNVTDASLATPGTDIITLSAATVTYPVRLDSASAWPSPFNNSAAEYWAFGVGCAPAANDTANFQAFKTLTQDPANPTQSIPLLLVDPAGGAWLTYRITDYRDGSNTETCTNKDPGCILVGTNVSCIQVSGDPENALNLNPPGGPRAFPNLPSLVVGSHFRAMRVCDGWLEQKEGLFDPSRDGGGGSGACPLLAAGTVEFPDYVAKAGWSPLLGNVEDFQIAYIFQNGDTWNGPGGTLTGAQGCTDGVPSFNNALGTPNPYDARSVIGLRITVTARSTTPVFGGGKTVLRPPAAEDHDPTTAPSDTYYRYQASVIAMLRNRTSGI